MKKILTIGLASLSLAIAPALATFAEEPSLGDSHDVTVGEVDEPIYSVDINWGDMTFDWKYNAEQNEFNFEPHYPCEAVSTVADGKPWLEYQRDNGWLFSDNTCAEAYTGEIATGTTYYAIPDGMAKSSISVADKSVNGHIQASASFAPEDTYNWVTGVFGRTDSGWRGPEETPEEPKFIEYTDGILDPIYASNYYGELRLKKQDSTATVHSVSTSDKIGTVTISITPDLN